jgi:hypothetical protein
MASVVSEGDYSATTDNKEKRKDNRRKRIEKRNAADLSKGDGSADASALEGVIKTGQEKVAESLKHLDIAKKKGLSEITSVRVRADETEAKRRLDDEKLRHERLGKLQHEALSSGK